MPFLMTTLDLVVDLDRGLPDQEKTACEHHQVLACNLVPQQSSDGVSQL